ncbi:hypothetical protein OEIGOIKO_07554 [Streptomyces chrestomyceticus JCM 4735]|uniref:Uncharacterized protein n=1 Tax=Streptomyces chrestomyceticus JCM 4735 TaxID=1306181 RepID=A0A7U9Q1H9_9ACTN|nr:hypothetical protein OEIGOIKO_07554 [Streptomyces chrestomyceticus JCM 4735]
MSRKFTQRLAAVPTAPFIVQHGTVGMPGPFTINPTFKCSPECTIAAPVWDGSPTWQPKGGIHTAYATFNHEWTSGTATTAPAGPGAPALGQQRVVVVVPTDRSRVKVRRQAGRISSPGRGGCTVRGRMSRARSRMSTSYHSADGPRGGSWGCSPTPAERLKQLPLTRLPGGRGAVRESEVKGTEPNCLTPAQRSR